MGDGILQCYSSIRKQCHFQRLEMTICYLARAVCHTPTFISKHGNRRFCIQYHLCVQKLYSPLVWVCPVWKHDQTLKVIYQLGGRRNKKQARKILPRPPEDVFLNISPDLKMFYLEWMHILPNINEYVISIIFFHSVIKLNTGVWIVSSVYAIISNIWQWSLRTWHLTSFCYNSCSAFVCVRSNRWPF